MADMATISAITGSVKAAIDIAKAIKDADVSLEKAELKIRMAELISALADTKIASAEIVEISRHKDAEIEKLRNLLKFKEKLIRVNEAYFEVDESGKPMGGPYCSHCWEASSKAIHLRSVRASFIKECPACQTSYRSHLVSLSSGSA